MDIVGIKRFLNKNKDKTLDEIISESVVNGIGNVIGNSGSPAGTDTLFGLLKRGFVKSVQVIKIGSEVEARGSDATVGSCYIATISATDPKKTIVFPQDYISRTLDSTERDRYCGTVAFQKQNNQIAIRYNHWDDIYDEAKVGSVVVYVVEFY